LQITETVHHPVRGDVTLVGQPVVLSRTPAKVVAALPEKGEHSDEILAEFGFGAAEISALKSAKVV
jgi:crotonobetainyl-CoA:carnitine CoA-transferase CaiB-like acyl-CoA transferase